RIGTEIHSWIERKSAGQATLLELEEEPDLTAEELAGQPGKIRQLREAFLSSRFANAVPLYAERADRRDLRSGGRSVGGGGLQDGPATRRRRARLHPARPVCARLHRRVGQASGGSHAHLPLPGKRRGGLARRAGPRPGARAGGGLAKRHPGGALRGDTWRALSLVRLPDLL